MTLKTTNPVIFLCLFPFLMVLSTLFIISPDLTNGIVTGKYFGFYVSMAILSVISFFALFKSTQPLRIGLSDWLILAFGIITLSVSYGVNHSEAITKHILLLLIVLLYFYLKSFLRFYPRGIYWINLSIMLTGMVEAYWGLRQLYGFTHSQHGLFTLTGSFFNPGPYACYLAVILPVAFYYVLRDWNCSNVKFKLRYWPVYLRWGIALITCTGIVLVLPASMSRASWLAAVGGCGLVVGCYASANSRVKDYYRRYRKRCLSGLVVIVGVLIGGCIGMYHLKKDSADGRALIWKNSIQVILQHPVGVGIGNFAGSYGDEQAAYFAAGKGTEQEELVAGNPEYGFNEYLQIGIEQGGVPLLLFMGFMVYSLYTGVKRKRIAPAAALMALLIVCTMSYPFSVLPFLIVLSFLLAWIHAGDTGTVIGKRAAVLLGLSGLVVVTVCVCNRFPTYQAYKQWQKESRLYSLNPSVDATKKYEALYPLLADQLPFLFEYAQSLSKTERFAESNLVLKKAVRISCDPMLYNIMGKNYQRMKNYAEAEACFRKSSYIVPHRIYPYYLLTNLFLEMGDMEKAKEYGGIVLVKEPKVQSAAVLEMRENVRKSLNID